ncbi:pre-mRNA-splicing factor 38A-like [Mytilus californianus]|uniref:pre-mRNA-splicing factor 38A-like n=1 Tax=Mytilus californianus TaxID=6549 RepID=UPI002247692A|nr:pre-mRNA-splicing factor 38A-like [Mytilus californianus]
MANRTVKDAHSIKGTNPQYLVEKIIRTRIYECKYWKEECFALTAELMVDKAMDLKFVGGVFGGNIKPTPFLCLVLKMLQIQPEKDIVVEFIRNETFKYVRALGALYMRLTGTALDCYKYLEPLYYDYRKIKRQNRSGEFELVHMDEFIDELLHEERVCDIILPRIQKRLILEENNQIEARVSAVEEDLEEMETSDEEEAMEDKDQSADKRKSNYKDLDRPDRGVSPKYRRSPSPARERNRKRSRSRDREKREQRHRDDDERRKKRKHRHEHKEKDKSRDSDRHRRHHGNDRHHHKRNLGPSKDEINIEEANELRAKLGLAPLKP